MGCEVWVPGRSTTGDGGANDEDWERARSVSVDEPAAWGRAHRDELEALLREHGALLFRGFGLHSVARFEAFVTAISDDAPTFEEESSPRRQVSETVYTSTDHPAAQPIQFHCEYSYSARWPMKLFFGCMLPASEGGETPISDTRRVLARLRPDLVDAFRRRKVLYARRFSPEMGVPWQRAFRTEDPAQVERFCRSAAIEVTWTQDGALRTRQVGDAIVRHPITSDELWFNHAFFFNVHAIEPVEVRAALLESVAEDSLSTHTYFGDGEPIPIDVIEEIRAAYRAAAIGFHWRRGDALLIDNMRMAHSRTPYAGSRKVVVAMTESFERPRTPRLLGEAASG